jgi:hypothetical protein
LAELFLSATEFTNPSTGTLELGAGTRVGLWVEELITRYLVVIEKRLSQEKTKPSAASY